MPQGIENLRRRECFNAQKRLILPTKTARKLVSMALVVRFPANESRGLLRVVSPLLTISKVVSMEGYEIVSW